MGDTLDPDVSARAFAMQAAMWVYDITDSAPGSIGDVVNVSECFLHYLGNGELNAFDCTDKLRPTVRGGI